MSNKEFGKQPARRTAILVIEIFKLFAGLSNKPEGKIIRNQITKLNKN